MHFILLLLNIVKVQGASTQRKGPSVLGHALTRRGGFNEVGFRGDDNGGVKVWERRHIVDDHAVFAVRVASRKGFTEGGGTTTREKCVLDVPITERVKRRDFVW